MIHAGPPSSGRLQTTLLALLLVPLIAGTAAAWQQRVGYTLHVDLDAERHTFAGSGRVVYVNNSPDTLREVYYHLFYEAFKPGSMMDIRDRNMPGGPTLGISELKPEDQGSVRVDSLLQDGAALSWSVDETILRAQLLRPLAPGDSTVFTIGWLTRIPKLLRRGGWMNREGVEFSMAQWYPKIAAYDASGWHPDEYVMREFYGVYGTFDVDITLPASYVVGGTGRVTNPDEVKCGYELDAADTILTSPASGTGRKTWRFHAENVHDFAWVADREYLHRISRRGGITLHMLYKRGVSMAWSQAATWTHAVLAYFGRRFGAYPYTEFTVAMAGDRGMEYPQLIMITGYRDVISLAGVIAHEVAHQWFYGIVGNNETQQAWLDEGFAQYLTDEARRDVFGFDRNPYRGLDSLIYPWIDPPVRNIDGYLMLAARGYSEPLSTYHDWFRESATGGLPYYKGEATLGMLEGILGRPLFDEAMRAYVAERRFRATSAVDFEHSVERTTGLRLDWFFNQWIELNRTLDYAATGLESAPEAGGYRTTLRMERRDDAVMPLDVTLRYEDGTTAVAHVPVEPWVKPGVDFNLPRWRWVQPDYEATFSTPKRVVEAAIDTSMLLVDLDRTNNIVRTGILPGLVPPSHVAFYKRWDEERPFDRYSIRLRPTLWYSRADGAQVGFVADGGYAFDLYNSKLGLYYNLGSRRVDYDLRYASETSIAGPRTRLSAVATNADGVQLWSIGVSKLLNPVNFISATSHRLDVRAEREVLVGGNYPNAVAAWTPGGYNTISLGYRVETSSRSGLLRRGSARADFDASFASASDFTQWRVAASGVWSLLGIRLQTELFAGASLGRPPAQRLFNAAGASSRAMHENLIQRLAMNAHPEFMRRNHLLLPTEGYLVSMASAPDSARLAPDLINARVTLPLPNPLATTIVVPFLSDVDVSLYGSCGWLFRNGITWRGFSDVHAEAGVLLTIDPLEVLLPRVLVDAIASPSPVRLGFYAPLVASSSLLERNGLAYRWGISVSL